jgi:hypothetical protein
MSVLQLSREELMFRFRRKNYKELISFMDMKKKGQVALFVIIALAIIGIVLVLIFYRQAGPVVGPTGAAFTPQTYLRACIEPEIKPVMENLANQGGYSNLEGALMYKGDKIKYLCYTSDYYETCVVQQPMIKEHFEKELNSALKDTINQCVQGLKEEYENRRYKVTMRNQDAQIMLSLKQINIIYDTAMTITKDSTRTYDSFEVGIESNMYDLIMIAQNIVQYEAVLGDSEITEYIKYYPDIIITKDKLSDGSKVYVIKNVVSQESFRFASRSLSWPAGFPE